MKPESTVYLEDCITGMRRYADNHFDLALVDPPYGIDINMNMGRRKGQRKKHDDKSWDSDIPDDEYFEELFRVSKNQIVWGANNFPWVWKNGCGHFIFWDKKTPEGMSFSDGELAWTSFTKADRKYTFRNITGDKIHPTQKPIALYSWLLHNYAKEGDLILDTHLGSGSSRIAADKGGFNFVGFEIDEEYYQAQEKRFRDYKSQLTLF